MTSRRIHLVYGDGYMALAAARAARDRSRERARRMASVALFILAMTAMGAALAIGFGGCGGEGAEVLDPPLYPECPRIVLETVDLDHAVCPASVPYTVSGKQTVKTGLCRLPMSEPVLGCVIMDNYKNPLWLCVASCEVSQ